MKKRATEVQRGRKSHKRQEEKTVLKKFQNLISQKQTNRGNDNLFGDSKVLKTRFHRDSFSFPSAKKGLQNVF